MPYRQEVTSFEFCNAFNCYSGCQKFLRFGFDVERSACLKTPPGSLLQPGYSNNSHGSLNLAMEAAALRGCIKVILFYSNCRTLEPNSALYPMKIIGKLKRLLAIAIETDKTSNAADKAEFY